MGKLDDLFALPCLCLVHIKPVGGGVDLVPPLLACWKWSRHDLVPLAYVVCWRWSRLCLPYLDVQLVILCSAELVVHFNIQADL